MHSLNRLCLMIIILAALSTASGIAQQTPEQADKHEERVVERLWRKPAPLEVAVIKTNRGDFLLGQKFAGDDSWFQEVSVVLENTSKKRIIYIGAGFLFPRPKSEAGKPPPFYQSVSYGHHPSAPLESNLKIQPLKLEPGKRISVNFSDSNSLSQIKAALRQLQYASSIKLIKFNLEEIYFDDGTAWVAGTWRNQVPDHTNDYPQEQQPFNSQPAFVARRESQRHFRTRRVAHTVFTRCRCD